MMLFFEKYLSDRNSKTIYPLPTVKGFLTYEHGLQYRSVEIIAFFWENAKGRPNSFCFRKTNDLMDSTGRTYASYNTFHVTWDKFFQTFDSIKSDILKKEKVVISDNLIQAKNHIWKSFVTSKDSILSKYVSTMPQSFFESISSNNGEFERYENQMNVVQYLRQNLAFIHASWLTYFESNMDNYYCDWFKGYCLQT